MESLADDEEMAEIALKQDRTDSERPGRGPRISEWSPELEALTAIIDRLGEVVQAQIASGGGTPRSVKPQPRPRTAMDKLRERKRREQHRKIVSRVVIQRGYEPPATVPAGPPPVAPDGEDPFRMRPPRRRPPGPATGEPLPPKR
jgi:hypothetical protein